MKLYNKYLVIKRKDISFLTDEAQETLAEIVTAINIAKQKDIDTGAIESEYLVTKKGTPEYEAAFKALSERIDSH